MPRSRSCSSSGSTNSRDLTPWVSQRSRAAVIAELYQARHSGELAAMTGEDSGSAFLSRGGASAAVRYAGPSPGQDDGTSVRLAMAGVPAVG